MVLRQTEELKRLRAEHARLEQETMALKGLNEQLVHDNKDKFGDVK